MNRTLLKGILLTAIALGSVQQANAQPTPLSAEQITAFNGAIAHFKSGQNAQQEGNGAIALSEYEMALPAIRDVVETQPDNLDNVKFLANVLYLAALAKAGAENFDAAVPLFEESLPLWRQVAAASATDTQTRILLTSMLIQLGNAKLVKQDKIGALPFYTEAISLARQAVSEKPDAGSKNFLLGALIGASQAGDDEAIKTEVAAMSKAMLADGTVDAANKPAAQILSASAR